MNGNTPYAGPGGDPTNEPDAELTPEQRRALRDSLARIAAQTREYLPDEYVVGAEIGSGHDGARATVAVRPPAGNPVSAGFTPEFDEEESDLVPADERAEVAQGLAASAALQVKQAFQKRSDDPIAK
ncbi:hypothetical protein EFA46_002385 [Halarchaeum sp. CBA1220]|uniref:DUF5811 family protein n=1 Tax=Halarchaeum sp. CBA1220 TaxID=1853682 RepID=UPI000F3A92C4|nr:DUF5811 family protein [Halarchaeum sp. CBA1220]QLC33102.1 hypothetical protein EFA46_002385 [Halarchaeum sp. CBA1220]